MVLPENWVSLFVGVEPKDTVKLKSKRRNDLFLAASKVNTVDRSFLKQCLPKQQNC